MDKAAVFIDGGYLSKVLKNVFGEPAIDFLKLSDLMCGNCERFRTYYYNCMPYQSNPPTSDEQKRYAEMQKFLYNLSRLPRFEIRLGRLQKIDSGIFRQKGIDVLLSIDMVQIAWTNKIEKAVLLSGDSDFAPAIKRTKEAGVLTTLYYSRGPGVYTHDELWTACDERYEIDKKLIKAVTV
jgi:uncharacterized LabA/DUF88 family protein